MLWFNVMFIEEHQPQHFQSFCHLAILEIFFERFIVKNKIQNTQVVLLPNASVSAPLVILEI